MTNSKTATKDHDSVGGSIMSDEYSDDGLEEEPSTTHATGMSGQDESTTVSEKLSKNESKNVFRLRLLVLLVLVLAAGSVSYIVYRLTDTGETDQFKTQYEGAAAKVIESFEEIVHKLGSISSLGVALTTHSIEFGSSYPFVTLPNWHRIASSALHQSEALFVGFAPVITREHFEEWDHYVSGDDNKWINEISDYQERLGRNYFQSQEQYERTRVTDRKVDLMHRFDSGGNAVREESPDGPYFPLWQQAPYVNASGLVNHNLLYRSNVSELVANVMSTHSAFIGPMLKGPPGNTTSPNSRTAFFATLCGINEGREALNQDNKGREAFYRGEPFAELYIPVFDLFNQTERQTVGVLAVLIQWESYLRNILPNSVFGIEAVIDYECYGRDGNLEADTDINGEDSAFTYRLDGPEAHFIGYGDQHHGFDKWMRHGNLITDNIDDGTVQGINVDPHCSYDIHVFPGEDFYQTYNTAMPGIITACITAVFVFMIMTFMFYDYLVEYRQSVVLNRAIRSTAVVNSLFPKNVRDRLMEDEAQGKLGVSTKTRIKGFLSGAIASENASGAPIADLFPHCTVFFADITGFTAWSSTREPTEVFILLQSLFQKFDAQAKRRRVFKVETIGDCYMAATGLPEPQDKHALNMVRFAFECLQATNQVTRQLECTLGPDTADLSIRIGIHSGPVTAGVLRGERARFQLFGDTVNTASRMESTGCRGRIQVSEETAKLLMDCGKEHWLTLRADAIKAKGKGVLKTYFAVPSSTRASETSGSGDLETSSDSKTTSSTCETPILDANERLVKWIVDVFVKDIKKMMHARQHSKATPSTENIVYHPPQNSICLDEITPSIHMADYNASIAACKSNHDFITMDQKVMDQLHDFVAVIASMYRDNPFHNFEHACHVVMSVKKLLARVVTPELSEEEVEKLKKKRHGLVSHLHEMTYGINSEPLTLVALTFAALIHDVDHRGVSNNQMIKEEPAMSSMYRYKSIAEQNSLDLAWEIFMEDKFQNLRRCLFLNQEEIKRFRQLVVNIVMATDIFDKDLNGQRRSRWEEAFATTTTTTSATATPDNKNAIVADPAASTTDNNNKGTNSSSATDFDSDLRATIVLEHVIQASDVSHTMQHWHVYQKWNKKLFLEMTCAFRTGRLPKDPKEFWYKGELGFFDNYIIPLAGKLKDCGVFGVSSHEYLTYAVQNRNEWQERGLDLVKDMVDELTMEREEGEDIINNSVEPGE